MTTPYEKIQLAFGWGSSFATIGAFKLNLNTNEVCTILFVTIPVGIWSWIRVVDEVRKRWPIWPFKKKNDSSNYRAEYL